MIERQELTETELVIARLLAEGKSNKEIAGEINISFHTVKSHLENIYKKLGVYNRVQLAVWYIQNF